LTVLTPSIITKAAIVHGGLWFHALPAAKYFNAASRNIESILELSAIETAIESGQILRPDGIETDVNARPIIVARKPLIGTVARNVQEYGTGALNIDGCRVETDDNLNGGTYSPGGKSGPMAGDTRTGASLGMFQPGAKPDRDYVQPIGRFPANLIHDGSDEVLAGFPEQKSGANPTRRGSPKFRNAYGEFEGQEECEAARGAESGSAARFFYCAKASKSDRTMNGQVDNKHPTVKPNSLMRYLCKLVTQPNGLVLDPFCGSGSTGVAAVQDGFRFVGIEMDEDSAATARERIRIATEADGFPLFSGPPESNPEQYPTF
jgi:site-specific DNA-methyltransferase (adenine-specific)